MHNNFRYQLASAIIALLAAGSSNAMLKKIYPKFDELIKLEELTGKMTDEKTLKAFYRGLFEDVVVQDIQKKQPYTRALGIKITPHGDLSIDRLPTTDAEGEKIAILIAQLFTNPKSSESLQAVQKFYQTKKNPDPTKNVDLFFPDIIIKNQADAIEHFKKINPTSKYSEGLSCFLDATTMKIIVTREHFTLENCHALLHEFTHFRQYTHGLESGAGYFRTLKKFELPLATAIELEAEFEALNEHPNKLYLLKQYAKNFSPADYPSNAAVTKEILWRFPYLTKPFTYQYIFNQLSLKNSDSNPTLTQVAKDAPKLFCSVVKLVAQQQKSVIELEKNGTKIFGMGGTDYPAEVFKLKEKFGLNPK